MARTFIFLSLLIAIFTLNAFAQEAKKNSKIDTLLQNQQKMLQNQQTILKNVVHHYVLEGKHFGVAFDPMAALLGTALYRVILSGAFSVLQFKGSEIIFPVYYDHSTKKDEPRDLITADVQYRRFFNAERPGFFVSAGARYAYLKGERARDWDESYDPDAPKKMLTVHKFGLYFGIGYRYFSPSGLYWGADINLGTYFSSNAGDFEKDFMDASRVLFDASFLRVGYAF